MKKSLVYTKTGDKGTTSLVGGTRVPKTHVRLEAYGTVDELNSNLGLLNTYLQNEDERGFILGIQHKLFVIGSHLATDQEKTRLKSASIISAGDIESIEREIDKLDEQLPELRAFILPGGSRGAAVCHICRTVCRRAERRILALSETTTVSPEVLAFVNRLSDYLFVLSRKINFDEQNNEIFWDNSWK
ncbi:cob(I)yrinic acid a,c-diamide adenosyltransferase [uncultured Bacteroides sp.]|uniref:cob(I)yrinic acid a,c-diamide adenosyltransferase n=1 Tax=uncultured Bacteroides sp. TaxID=162156 RepID=UPI0026767142|nr:cob(I)yrinic acid a,c-diamide adenosyltransferase [uncultured Bacteroides sp.]